MTAYLLPAALGLAAFALMLGPRRAQCALGLHRPPPGLRRSMCIAWTCARCGRVRPGDLAARRWR